MSRWALVASSKLKLNSDYQFLQQVTAQDKKTPDESGANAMVLVAPVEGFPLKPGEQLPHGVQHVGHGGHNRGENHLGNKSLRWIPGVRQES